MELILWIIHSIVICVGVGVILFYHHLIKELHEKQSAILTIIEQHNSLHIMAANKTLAMDMLLKLLAENVSDLMCETEGKELREVMQ